MVSRLYSVVYTPCYSVHIQTYMDCMHSIESFNRSEICTILRSWCLLPHQFNNGTSIPYPPFFRAIQSDSNNIKHSRTSLVISPRIKKKEKKIKQRNIFLIKCPQPAHARHLRHGQTTSKSPFFQHPHIQDHPGPAAQQQPSCTVTSTTTCSSTIPIESSFQIQHEHDNHGRHTAPGGAGPVLRAPSDQ